jgi:salicylate hydroxylase
VVAGGGIGGLAVALAAARRGHRVVVLERAERFSELGAGIQLAPNAFRALDHLGVGAAVRERAVFVDELRLMDAEAGGVIARLELIGAFTERFGAPYAVVHRTDVHEPLLRACREHPLVDLRAGCRVTGYERAGDGVRVLLESGEVIDARGLVGADGLRSTVRRRLLGDGPPRVSGHTIYRSVVPIDDVAPELRWNAATLWAGPGFHLVHYPIAGARSFNLAVTVDDGAREEVVGVPVLRDHVLAEFGGVRPEVRALLELGRDWRSWVLCDRDPVTRWTDGPVLLVGDAAHPMLQYAAQGAAMALEDAVCLEAALGRHDDLAEAFARVESLRVARTGRVQLVSRRMGEEVYHPAGPAAAARTELLAGLDRSRMLDELDWLYAHEAVPVA